jgi:hypothetical protein
MSSVIIAGNTSGTITLDAPNVAGTTTLTLPTTSGTVLTTANTFGAGTGPAFSAYPSSTQSITSGTWTKVLFQTEEWDTNNNFASSTFTPTVAGYYQVNARAEVASNFNQQNIAIYKNGSQNKQGVYGSTNFAGTTISALVYCNGSTDYLEIYVNLGITQVTTASSITTYFQAFLARSA